MSTVYQHILITPLLIIVTEYGEDTPHMLRAKGVIDEHFKIVSDYNTITPENEETIPLPGHPLPPMSADSVSIQTQITLDSPISSEQPTDFIMNDMNDEQVNNLNTEVKAFVEYVEDALCVLRAKGVIDENFKILSDYNTITPSNNQTTPLPGHDLTPVFASPASTQTETTPHSPISSKQPTDFIVNDMKDEQINNLNAEVKALKSFIIVQLYVIKKSIEDFKGQKNISNSGSSVLIQSLKEELHYLRNENLAKTSIIKSLTENHCIPANINSVLFPQNLHREKVQDDKSSPNKSSESSKTEGKCIILNEIKSQANQKNNQNLRSDNPQRKKTLILGDSIVKHVEGWRLNKRMKSAVSVRCIPGATTNAMKHHLKGCLEDSSPDNIILHHETNNLKSADNSEKIASDIVNLGLSVKNEKTKVYISSLVIRNDKLDKKLKEVNDFIKKHYLTKHLSFIDLKI